MKYKDYDFIKTLRGDVPVELVNGTIQTTRQVHVANTALNLGSNKEVLRSPKDESTSCLPGNSGNADYRISAFIW
ncbi:hypothetical protein H4Q26_004034 [Puccinia striiformis f. sp. tritici PST-130]|nr:hypothetical protein H4Q26_004034 [Puccinia striiformis f. sp. tritici PST-130]